jgi:hypothetical protein
MRIATSVYSSPVSRTGRSPASRKRGRVLLHVDLDVRAVRRRVRDDVAGVPFTTEEVRLVVDALEQGRRVRPVEPAALGPDDDRAVEVPGSVPVARHPDLPDVVEVPATVDVDRVDVVEQATAGVLPLLVRPLGVGQEVRPGESLTVVELDAEGHQPRPVDVSPFEVLVEPPVDEGVTGVGARLDGEQSAVADDGREDAIERVHLRGDTSFSSGRPFHRHGSFPGASSCEPIPMSG